MTRMLPIKGLNIGFDMKNTLSPLRYPGGKGKIAQFIYSLMPPGSRSVCSPFFGGGGVEIYLANKGIRVFGYDIFKPLTDFWQELIRDPGQLSEAVKSYYPISKQLFSQLKGDFKTTNCKTKRASIFYALNRTSFSGLTFSGGFSPGMARFTEKGIQSLASFKTTNLSVKNEDFNTSIAHHTSYLLFLDPPYFSVKNLYGQWGSTQNAFNHQGLARILNNRGNWIMTYDDCDYVRHMYRGHHFIKLKGSSKTPEVVILSNDLSFQI